MGRDSKCRQVFLLCESSEKKKKKKKPGRKKEYRESTPSEKVMFQMTLNKKKNVSVSGHIASSSEIDKFIKYPQGIRDFHSTAPASISTGKDHFIFI